jgi:LMBR1 domain-containing protein 1
VQTCTSFKKTFSIWCFFLNNLEELQEQEMTLSRNDESIKVLRRSFWFKFRYIYRPMQIIFGVLLILFALLIFISLLLSNINKCIHFTSFKNIFAQGNKSLPNPIDIIVTWTGQVSDKFE